MVHSQNLPETIEQVIESLNLSEERLNSKFKIVSNDKNIEMPPEWLIKGYINI